MLEKKGQGVITAQAKSPQEKALSKVITLMATSAIIERRLQHNEIARSLSMDHAQVRRLSHSISTDKGRIVHIARLIERIKCEGLAESCPKCSGRGWVFVWEPSDPDFGGGFEYKDACPECQGDTDREAAWVQEEFEVAA